MKIRIFTFPGCPWCDKVKEFFKSKRKRFQEILINKDEKGKDEMIERTKQFAVPVTIVEKKDEDKIIIGYDLKKLKDSLS